MNPPQSYRRWVFTRPPNDSKVPNPTQLLGFATPKLFDSFALVPIILKRSLSYKFLYQSMYRSTIVGSSKNDSKNKKHKN